jgi:hypothetical protein
MLVVNCNTTFILISLQTYVAVYMNVSCYNMGDKMNQQNLTDKFNCSVMDVAVYTSVTWSVTSVCKELVVTVVVLLAVLCILSLLIELTFINTIEYTLFIKPIHI